MEARLEKRSCAGCHHAPYSVDDATEEQGGEDVFLEEEFQWYDDARESELLFRSGVTINQSIGWWGECVDKRSMDSGQAQGAIAGDGAQGFGEEKEDQKKSDRAEAEEEPEYRAETKKLSDNPTKDRAN